MADHPPAARRAVLRALKHGTHPVGLLDDARAIGDPGHAASALLAIAADPRVPADKVEELVHETRRLLRQVDRPGRMAEAWGEALAVAATIRRGPSVTQARDALEDACVKAVLGMPDGRWTTDTILAVAPHLGGGRRRRILRRALSNPGHEVEPGKLLVDLEPELMDVVKEHASPKVASLILGHAGQDDAVAAAWAIEDATERREAFRVLVWRAEDEETLLDLAASCRGKDAADRVHAMAAIGGRADRLGHPPAAYFEAAAAELPRLGGAEATKAHRKLAQAMERSGMTPPPPPKAPAQQEAAVDVPVEPGRRHVLAIVDGYTGGLDAPHVRAVARAAPLCMAFGLDLAIIGFPTEDVDALVDLVEAETNVGEGEGYARRLQQDGRLWLMPLAHGVPGRWPGTPVATTPHPAEEKACRLEDVEGRICLLVGLGKAGLPPKMLAAVEHHHELTGQGISLETATAMGILADRLGRLS